MADEAALCLAGPTASGKSALAMALCAARPGEFEIISVDSAQVYRGMDIGTAKPDAGMRSLVPHHLIDLLDPAESYSAARFVADARTAMASIRARGRRPLLVGGTMLYFRALMTGLSVLPAADTELRAGLAAQAQREGWPALHARLAKVDPVTAARIHPNDAQRIQRALEIHALTGQAPSALYAAETAAQEPDAWRAFALLPDDRAGLHAAIARRFDAMLVGGFLDEVRRLHARADLSADLASMRAVGYRQLWAFLDGHCSFEEARELALAATRQYAKRQYTWLRSEPGFVRLPVTDALDFLQRRLASSDVA
ncbi:MAG TPA: tRNA (adenosine(37)-N6)-dimethylallyltransferase MiaA [Nevskiaceae bacterium]|nr:tRNA (adenosine(37)-N6)-dimethylallyltransferase MiaA [Nevskiaceae bacterium]